MKIEDYLLRDYPTAQPFDCIKSIEKRLKEKDYLVVEDENNKFYGILTPSDVLSRPYKLVIDCLTPKEMIKTDDSFDELISKFENTPSEALPVFHLGNYRGILEKSATLKKLKFRIDDLREESSTAQKVKTAFLQNLSHEIRTPLNHILGFMGIVANLSPEEIEPNRKEYYTIIQKSSEHFLLIMNDLIELSRLYSGDKVLVYNEDTSIESIFSGIKAEFEGNAILYSGKRNISYQNPDKALILFTDSKKIKLIIYRLISYMIKQIQKTDGIEFGCELLADNQKIRFYIKNTGAQIAGATGSIQSVTIKQSFYPEHPFQYEPDFSMELARKMVELLEGTLEFERVETNLAKIYFTIPCNSLKYNDVI